MIARDGIPHWAGRSGVGARLGADDVPAHPYTGGKGADVVLDLVGGVMFRSVVNSLALRGRLVEIAATGQREVPFDLVTTKAGSRTRSSATPRRLRRGWMR